MEVNTDSLELDIKSEKEENVEHEENNLDVEL